MLPTTYVEVYLNCYFGCIRAIDLMIINNTTKCYIYGPSKKNMDLHETGNFTWFSKRKKMNSKYQASFHYNCYWSRLKTHIYAVFFRVYWSWMDILSSKEVQITGPSIKFTRHSHTQQRRCSDSYWSFCPVMNNLLLDQTNFYWTLPNVRHTLGMTLYVPLPLKIMIFS